MDDDLYDAYVDRMLAGTAEPPDVFLGAHPEAGPELRARVVALHRMATANAAGAARRPGLLPPAAADVAATRAATPGSVGSGRLPAAEGLPFARLGGLRLIRRIGSGGMGDVYLAEDESLGRPVALKVLRPELERSPAASERFRREALAVAKLRHPSIVTLYGAGEDGGVRFLAMEYVAGHGLDEILSRTGGAAAPDVVRWAAQIARALGCAHEAGIVHRDVKPSNVCITPDGRAMLVDFGIARDLSAPGATLTGPMVGSPVYAAPEQVTGGRVDARTDVYGLGVTLYEALAGAPPHDATTMEDALRRVLHDDPVPVRRRNPAVSRDLAVVVAKAMEKDPARRYASADALADDLEAVLAFRPIRARPPGPVRRLAKWARRNPAAAAASATCIAAAIGAGAWSIAREVETRRAARADAAAAVRAAAGQIDEYRSLRAALQGEESQLHDLELEMGGRHLSADETRFLERKGREIAASRRRRESIFHQVLDLLVRAERLDPSVAGTEDTRADLYLEKWHEARTVRDRVAESFYRDLVREHDLARRHEAELAGRTTLSVTTDPPGAEVYLFRYAEHTDVVPEGSPRLVPVPVQAAAPAIAPGTVVLEITSRAPGARNGDLVISLAGRPVAEIPACEARRLAAAGGPATVWHDGEVVAATLPSGTETRATAAPLLRSGACRIGTTPLADVGVDEGDYVLLLVAPGHEPQRVTAGCRRGTPARIALELVPEGEAPRGFVRVVPPAHVRVPPFWMQEREVTSAEYLEFLNDPATLAEIDSAAAPVRVPRKSVARASVPHWVRAEGGTWSLGDAWNPDWPVVGVSHDDAVAYAAWFGRRLHDRGAAWTAGLPTADERSAAATGCLERQFVFGDRFLASWMKSCFSAPRPGLEPVASYPIDESPWGVVDLCGSVAEWADAWYDDTRTGRSALGGSWAWARWEMFTNWAALSVAPDVPGDEFGIRLALRPAERVR